MLGKLLKRKDSRQAMELHPTENKGQQDQKQNMLQYKYQRPDILGKVRAFTSRSFGIYRTTYSDDNNVIYNTIVLFTFIVSGTT